MKRIQLLSISIVLLLISFVLIGCSGATIADNAKEVESSYHANTSDNSQNIKGENRYPILEIWEELDGSVPIRGKFLHFRLYDDGVVDFAYQLRKENESGKPRYIYSIEKAPPTKISEEEFRRLKSLFEELRKSKEIKQEYKPVALTLDVITKLTILLNENETTKRKILINDSDLDIMDSRFEKKFPSSMVNLIKEVHLIRTKLQEKSVEK